MGGQGGAWCAGSAAALALLLAGCAGSPGPTDVPSGAASSGPSSATAKPPASAGGGGAQARTSRTGGHGPAGADLVARVDVDRIMGDVETLAASPRDPVQNPAETRAAADYVAAQLGDAGLTPQTLDVIVGGSTLPVVYAEVPGTRCPEKVFVLVGHYDTVPGSPGADDNASGVAATLETGRILANAPQPATVVVAGVPFEELGPPYPASRALGQHLLDDGREIVGMLSAEMLGYALPEPAGDDPGDYLMLLGYEGAEDLVATFERAAEDWVPGFPVRSGTYPPDESFIDRSDHAAFHDLGVPAAFATDGANFRTPHYHQETDIPENIDVDFFGNSVRTLVGGTAAMAGQDLDGDGTADACR